MRDGFGGWRKWHFNWLILLRLGGQLFQSETRFEGIETFYHVCITHCRLLFQSETRFEGIETITN